MSDTRTTAVEQMQHVIESRRLERELIEAIAAAFRQHHRILQLQPDWNSVTETGNGEVKSALNSYLAEVDSSESVSHGADIEVHERLKALVNLGEAAFCSHPCKIDEVFENELGDEKVKNDSEKMKEMLYSMKKALQNHMHNVRAMGKELCGRTRSLRFVTAVDALLKPEQKHECFGCRSSCIPVDQVGVLAACGHFGCLSCLRRGASSDICLVPGCSANISIHHVVSSERLNLGIPDSRDSRFGRKLSAIVEKVKEIIRANDRVIVFCQFDDLKEKVREAIEASHIKTVQVKGSVKAQIKALGVFQKDRLGREDL